MQTLPSSDANPAVRLAGTAGVQRVPTLELGLFVLRGFLDQTGKLLAWNNLLPDGRTILRPCTRE